MEHLTSIKDKTILNVMANVGEPNKANPIILFFTDGTSITFDAQVVVLPQGQIEPVIIVSKE